MTICQPEYLINISSYLTTGIKPNRSRMLSSWTELISIILPGEVPIKGPKVAFLL